MMSRGILAAYIIGVNVLGVVVEVAIASEDGISIAARVVCANVQRICSLERISEGIHLASELGWVWISS